MVTYLDTRPIKRKGFQLFLTNLLALHEMLGDTIVKGSLSRIKNMTENEMKKLTIAGFLNDNDAQKGLAELAELKSLISVIDGQMQDAIAKLQLAEKNAMASTG